jgi:hypothetical protein
VAEELERIARAVGERFRIERRVGMGGMASVYLAEDLRHHRQVAIKVLEAQLSEAVGAERFTREIETIANLHHPHILPLHDSGGGEGFLYFVMPFVTEGTLRDRLDREGAFPVEDALRLAREVAEALAYAHAKGIVHRDIKPENIMLDSGHAVLSDFGIAVLVDSVSDERLTRTGVSPGTPAYMSPEQAAGGGDADPRSDIYSLGCVLYEMLAGETPFSGASKRALIARKLADPTPPIRTVRENLPEPVERVALRALERVPADRQQSARELVAQLSELESAVRDADARAAVFGLGSAAGNPWTRRLAVAALATAGVAVLLTVIGVLTTRVFDYRVQMPPMHRPSRSDYLVVGIQSLVPFVVYGLVALGVGFLLTRSLAPIGRRITTRLGSMSAPSLTGTWKRISRRASPDTLADLFLLAIIAVSILALWPFRGLYLALVQPAPQALACASRMLHNLHFLVLPALIVGVGVARHSLFRWIRRRGAEGGKWRIARWASAGWLVLLVVIMALPWRVLWDAYYERALIDGEPAYLIEEADEGVLAYTPATRSVRLYRQDGARIEQRGVAGYLFEEPEVFASSLARCGLIWTSSS